MKRICYLLLPILALATACTSHSEGADVLCVSIEPQRWLLDQLVGDNYQTIAILSNGANPESYEPSMSDRKHAAEAKAIFITGQLPYEQAITTGTSAPICDTSSGLDLLTGTHGHSHGDNCVHDADPHIWSSARNAKVMAANMLDALVQLDPAHADQYNANYARLAQRLDSIDMSTAQRLKQAGTHAFAVWHPSLSYYARDYGLHQISVGQENKETTIGNLHQAIQESRADSVKVFFFQKEFDSRQAQTINREIGSRLVEINPLSYDWETQFTLITDELVR